MIGLLFLPDSPRWLLMKGRTEEGHDVIARLLGEELDHPDVLAELSGIQESLYIQSRGGGFKYRELFTNGPSQNFRRTFLGCLSQFCQQFTGINLVVSCRSKSASVDIQLIIRTRLTTPPTFLRILLASILTFLASSRLATVPSTSWHLYFLSQRLTVSVAALSCSSVPSVCRYRWQYLPALSPLARQTRRLERLCWRTALVSPPSSCCSPSTASSELAGWVKLPYSLGLLVSSS
jgi:hypothetical protein